MTSSNLRYSRRSTNLFWFLAILLFLSAADVVVGQPGQSDQRNNNPYDTRFSPVMAALVVVLIAALFFMAFFSIYVGSCINSRNDGSVPAVGGARSRRLTNAAASGLDASVIETFPTFVYSEVKTLKIGKGALECAVCLNEFEDDETLRLLPKCDHVFHPHCIDPWLQAHVTCPVCRTNLAETDPGQPEEPTQTQTDLEAQNGPAPENVDTSANQPPAQPPTVIDLSKSMNGKRTRGSRSGRPRVNFARSHTTGHSLVQPGEDTERFTLRLTAEAKKQIEANRDLNRAGSLVLPREGSSRRGKRVENRLQVRSDRWLFRKTSSFLWRNPSVRSPKVVAADGSGEGSSVQQGGEVGSTADSVHSDRWAFLKTPSFLWRSLSIRSPSVAGNDGNGERSSIPVFTVADSTSGSVRLPV